MENVGFPPNMVCSEYHVRVSRVSFGEHGLFGVPCLRKMWDFRPTWFVLSTMFQFHRRILLNMVYLEYRVCGKSEISAQHGLF